ncbi:glycine cleavage system aminomethyltransferase GcvT [Microcella alkalica]|uniref:glycine cleavage system aminomethyltransferase GcvT n=1 Tax=Microcella alkalica TaxID=355930 RepID=UPI00145E22D2|nr:glycine cleavage system aminomethyltransferase GcvT [Microcella alkalica]
MSEPSTPVSRLSPLHDQHVALGASFTDFAGWQMPVRYTSDLAEHHAVRTAAGLFDISHMAEIAVIGEAAGAFLDEALAGRLSALSVGKAKYSLILDEHGGIIDDLIVYRITDHEFLVVANASNRDAVVAALTQRTADHAVAIDDRTDATALIAVQGPAARAVLEATSAFVAPELDELKYYAWTTGAFVADPASDDSVAVLVARTGYTGEDGFELYLDTAHAAGLWAALLEAGAPLGLQPCGLASRDTLRLEAGMPLYGHELGLSIQPVQAGLGRVVVTDKPHFVGKEAIERGPGDDARVLVGLAAEGRRAARAGYPVMAGDEVVGEITSGALSPTLGHPIAMAFVHPAHAAVGAQLDLDVRGSRIPATVVPLPFYKKEA